MQPIECKEIQIHIKVFMSLITSILKLPENIEYPFYLRGIKFILGVINTE